MSDQSPATAADDVSGRGGDEAVARARARARHPSMRWRPPPGELRQRLALRLSEEGVAHADVAASLLEARARAGSLPPDFAAELGVDADSLARAEAGECPVVQLPPPLRDLLLSAWRHRPR